MDAPHFNPDDQVPMAAEELADSIGISRAFVQLVIDAGCPHENELLTRHSLFNWLSINADVVRAMAGLAVMPPISDCTILKTGEMQEERAMLTMLHFMHARACSNETRQLCEKLTRFLSTYQRRW